MNIQLYNGDCLELMKNIPDGSVDLVLTDPPYGTMKGTINRDFSNLKEKDGSYSWDDILPTNELFCEISRILRQNGKCILFSQEPYTSHLVTNQIASLPFSYRAIWYKNTKGNHLMAKSAMVSRYEDICVFSKLGHDYCGENPLREYFSKVLEFIGAKSCKEINVKLGHRRAEHCFYVTGKGNGSTQFSLCTEQTYQELIDVFGIDKMQGFTEYEELRKAQDDYTQKYASIFNLWQGGKSKSNVLEYAKDNDGYHPTQKPVKLLEDLIQTYSNEGNTVLDFTMGSGSTGVACVNTNRNFIGIELDKGYFDIAEKRISEAQNI